MTASAVHMLREQDQQFLADSELNFTVSADAGFADLIITGFKMPPGVAPEQVDLLIRLPFGFPDASPDMFWVTPNLTTSGGQPIPGTEMLEHLRGRYWQRWSRHISAQWRPGVDNLETYLAYIRQCLRQAGGT